MSGQTETIAIIAGKGSLPNILADELISQNKVPFLIGLGDQFEPWIQDYKHEIFAWGEFGRLFSVLKSNDINKLVMAGSMIRPKVPSIRGMDFGAIIALPQIIAVMIGGDNNMLSGIIEIFAKRGVTIIGAHEIMPELLTQTGMICGDKIPKESRQNMIEAINACKSLGELDIGQASIAVGKRVIAVEGIEGTDAMIDRVTDLRLKGWLVEKGRHGVLVKSIKPNQDMRVDLPAIGPTTVQQAAEAGLRGIAIEAGHSIIVERKETLEHAMRKDIFIYGFDVNKDDVSNG